jgi:hypothetical protein
MAPAVSDGFCHPLPALAELPLAEPVPVNVGADKVATVPVGVYDGRRVAAPALAIDVGGHAYEAVTAAGIWPAPVPPVCHADKEPENGFAFLHAPIAERGSVGIHPSCRPS